MDPPRISFMRLMLMTGDRFNLWKNMSIDNTADEAIERGLDSSPQQEEHRPEPATTSPTSDLRPASPGPDQGHRLPLPVWMRESSKSFHWKWVPLPLRRVARAVAAWSKGPDPPQIQRIRPFFPSIQEAPVRLFDRFFPKKKHKAAFLVLFYFCWILTFSLVLHHSASAGEIEGYGQPSPIWCGAGYWCVFSDALMGTLYNLLISGLRETIADLMVTTVDHSPTPLLPSVALRTAAVSKSSIHTQLAIKNYSTGLSSSAVQEMMG